VNPTKLTTPKMPTQRQRAVKNRPFGKTNVTAIGQA
jgi:hypothetical protein